MFKFTKSVWQWLESPLSKRCYKTTFCLAVAVMVSNPVSASDLEIYSASIEYNNSAPVITLMLDVSPSMGVRDPGKQLSRVDYLKLGVIDLVNSPELFNKVKIGIGVYPDNSINADNTERGRLIIPVKLLDQAHKQEIISKVNALTLSSWTPIAQGYAEAGAYMMGTSTLNNHSSSYSGFYASINEVKSGNHYISPFSSPQNQCAGGGIYVLTDGYPASSNQSSMHSVAMDVMNASLKNQAPVSCSTNDVWSCIFAYNERLLDPNNAIGKSIKTATVGYGNSFDIFENATSFQDCDKNLANKNASNLCKWGFAGGGGFYYAEDSEGIVNSIKSFIVTLNEDVEPIATGNMAVPLDRFSKFQSRKIAYLPILDPKPGKLSLWRGNLKKYKVNNATLKGDNNKPVFKNIEVLFAADTWDIWNVNNEGARKGSEGIDANGISIDVIPNDAIRPDKGLPQVGGAFQQIFENGYTRNLFVNSHSELVHLSVHNNSPHNFTQLSDAYNNQDKLNLLKFMGYQLPTNTVFTDSLDLTGRFNKWSKNIGGVLHSTPQLITTNAKVNLAGDVSEREDYVLYGSMDGALHLISDSTAKEVFTFIPKQLLKLQPNALSDNGTTISGSLPYGVDAPWETYTYYEVKANVVNNKLSSNTYKSKQIFSMGGLRMGGSMYYALDMSTIDTPKLIYSVGSTYANKREDIKIKAATAEPSTSLITGIKNNAIGDSADHLAFSRMGQTWAKPTIGYVKHNGKRVMVNFLAGGYDDCYEDPRFKLNSTGNTDSSCNNKTSAQGNAMYMVQVGTEKTNITNDEVLFDTNNGGKLLWWASNTGLSNTNQYSNNSDLNHSIVTQLRALDRNNDGLTDHIYFADLGGQVWRADINNTTDSNNFSVDRVQKILDVSDQASGSDAPPRFYERPLITFYNGEYTYINNDDTTENYTGVMAMVTVGTGDRSSPVNASRNTPDALYNFIDKDVTRADFFTSKNPKTLPMRSPIVQVNHNQSTKDSNKLAKLTFTPLDIGVNGIKTRMKTNKAQGWYMPFNHWMGEEQVSPPYKLKMMNEPDALSSVLILSTYNPDKGNTASECSAGVVGKTQRESTCLPYGACEDKLTSRKHLFAGSGIIDNFITQYNDTSIFTSIKNFCQGDDCKPVLKCTNGDCETLLSNEYAGYQSCRGAECNANFGILTDERLNPLEWMEF